jgi:hypothetical protein
MKWFIILLFALPLSVTAQNLGKEFAWAKIAPTEYSVKSKKPYYEITVNTDNEAFTKDKLKQNADFYFKNLFSTELVKQEGKNTMTGVGNYSFNISKNGAEEGLYTVTYILDISWKDSRYTLSMHDFVIEHVYTTINIGNRLELSEKNDVAAKTMFKYFNSYNLTELKKAYNAMSSLQVNLEATASR